MRRSELVRKMVRQHPGISAHDIDKIVTVFFEEIVRSLAAGDRETGFRLPVGRHQLGDPFWLSNLTARQELAHNRLDVDHGRSVDRV